MRSLDHMPVLAIVGQQARTAIGGHYQQEIDLAAMFKDVAGACAYQASTPSQVRHLIDRAYRTAKAERCVTAIILPNDLQELEYEEPARAHGDFARASATASRKLCLIHPIWRARLTF